MGPGMKQKPTGGADKRPTINVGGNMNLVLPPDCKVLAMDGRLVIEAPCPKPLCLRREKIARAIWLSMIPATSIALELDADWEESAEGKAAFVHADAVLRLIEEGE